MTLAFTTATSSAQALRPQYAVQIDWMRSIDHEMFFESGAISVQEIVPAKISYAGFPILRVDFDNKINLINFMIEKFGVSYSEIENYEVP